jgi:hypothetical protein
MVGRRDATGPALNIEERILAIPESRLEQWATQGPIAGAVETYESIREALAAHRWPPGASYNVRLRGSYHNSTNIRADAAVDVLVELKSTYAYRVSSATAPEMTQCTPDESPASYEWKEFNDDVLAVLTGRYGKPRISEAPRGIKVRTEHLVADVVPCVEYRRFKYFAPSRLSEYVQGIAFFLPRQLRWIVRYPDLHYENGLAKEEATSGRFKRTVRMFKSARTYLYERGHIAFGLAPSYYLECLIYNVQEERFSDTLQRTYLDVLEAIVNGNLRACLSQDGQEQLFGYSADHWSERDALKFVGKLIDLWGR